MPKIPLSQNRRDALTTIAVVLGVFFFPFLLRLFFIPFVKNDPMFVYPIIDSLEFDMWAYRITQGEWLWHEVNNHPPLYAYFLAGIYLIFGYSPLAAVFCQYLLFAVTMVLVFWLIRQYFSFFSAVTTVILISTYWFYLYMNSFLYSENLSIFLDVLLIFLLLRLNDGVKKYVICGVVFGLAGICRPAIMPFGLVLWVWFVIKSLPVKVWWKYYLIFLLSAGCVIAPVIVRNYVVSGEALLRSQAGANIYMGSDPAYQGTNLQVEIGKMWTDFISQPGYHHKRQVTLNESDRYFLSKTLQVIRDNPWGWVKLVLGKVFSIFTGREFLRSEDVYVYHYYISHTPFALVSTPVIFILSLVGLGLAWKNRLRVELLYLFIAATFASFIFFPIKTRYLADIAIVLFFFAAYTIECLFDALKNRCYKKAGGIVVSLIVLQAISFCNPLNLKKPDVSEAYYAIAKNYIENQRYKEAGQYFQATITINPKNISAYNDYGVLLMNLGHYSMAVDHFQKALELDPQARNPRLNYELCVQKMREDAQNP